MRGNAKGFEARFSNLFDDENLLIAQPCTLTSSWQ
jgi:hypothetical protein